MQTGVKQLQRHLRSARMAAIAIDEWWSPAETHTRLLETLGPGLALSGDSQPPDETGLYEPKRRGPSQ